MNETVLRPLPLDLDHLRRQTMQDADLQAEVLRLFVDQARMLIERMAGADENSLRELAHALKGASRSIGCFELGDAADRIERRGEAGALLEAAQSSFARALAEIHALQSRMAA
jgi:HPt (histidine-containing phosphotransfer) domain-containing protein